MKTQDKPAKHKTFNEAWYGLSAVMLEARGHVAEPSLVEFLREVHTRRPDLGLVGFTAWLYNSTVERRENDFVLTFGSAFDCTEARFRYGKVLSEVMGCPVHFQVA